MVTTVLRRAAAIAVPLAAVLFAAACSGSSTPTTPSGPSTNPTTENFTGTVPVGGSDVHNFTITLSNGQLNLILTAAGPPATIFEGFGVGTPSGSTCSVFSGGSVITQAGATAQLSSQVGVASGSYCVVVYDAGNQSSDITYAVTVTHY